MNCIHENHIRKGWTFDHYVQDFKIHPTEDIIRGIYESMSHKSYVYVGRHETLDEIYHTSKHEDLHAVFDHVIIEDNLNIDVEMEHWAIRQMMWVDESL